MPYGVAYGNNAATRIPLARTQLPIASIAAASGMAAGVGPNTFTLAALGLYQIDLDLNVSAPSNDTPFSIELYNETLGAAVQSRNAVAPQQSQAEDMWFGFEFTVANVNHEYSFYITPLINRAPVNFALLLQEINFRAVVQEFSSGGNVNGTGTPGRLPVWTLADTIGDSQVTDDGAGEWTFSDGTDQVLAMGLVAAAFNVAGQPGVDITVRGRDAGGADQNGSNLTLQGGAATGTGTEGEVRLANSAGNIGLSVKHDPGVPNAPRVVCGDQTLPVFTESRDHERFNVFMDTTGFVGVSTSYGGKSEVYHNDDSASVAFGGRMHVVASQSGGPSIGLSGVTKCDTPGLTISASLRGLYGLVWTDPAAVGTTYTGENFGLYGNVYHQAGTVMDKAFGVRGRVQGIGSAITRGAALHANPYGGTVTNHTYVLAGTSTIPDGHHGIIFNDPGTNDLTADSILTASAADMTPFVIQGVAGQTAPLTEYQQSDGTVTAKVDDDGTVTTTGNLVIDSDTSQLKLGDLQDVGAVRSVAVAGTMKITDGSTAHGALDVGADDIQTTSTDGLVIANDTPASAGVPVQYTPRLRQRHEVWDTDGSSDTWDWWWEATGLSGATTNSYYRLQYSRNGAAGTTRFTLNPGGGSLSGAQWSFSNESMGASLGLRFILGLRDDTHISWSNDATYYGTKDLHLLRQEANTLGFGDGTNQVLAISLDGATPSAFSVTGTAGVDVWIAARDAEGGDRAGGCLVLKPGANTGTGVVGRVRINLANVPIYANNAAALAAGLVAGDLYRTNADPDPLCIVH